MSYYTQPLATHLLIPYRIRSRNMSVMNMRHNSRQYQTPSITPLGTFADMTLNHPGGSHPNGNNGNNGNG